MLAELIEKTEISARALSVSTLALTQFRNYERLRLEAPPVPVILTGPNGAGKTNILEALSLLTAGRGMRRAKLSELSRQVEGEANAWAISATVHLRGEEVQIGTGLDAAAGEAEKRLVRINGAPAKGHAALSDYVSVVWLTPQMDMLFQEGQSARRKFIDRLVYSFDVEHASRVNAYEYAMRERNRLLATGRADARWLSSLEHKMAEASVAIAHARLSTVSHLNEVMQASPLSFPKAHLTLSGDAEDALVRGEAAVLAEQALTSRLAELRGRDADSGRANAGAHRSELTVMHLGKGMEAALCSTGEQKALLLAMVLAEARAGAIWHGRVPLVLLDEVVAHLDPEKRTELYEEILALGAQAWMTGTDVDFFHGMRDKAVFIKVKNSMIITGK